MLGPRKARTGRPSSATFVIALAALLAGAGGCGGGGGSGGGGAGSTATVAIATSSLSKPEFVQRAQAACQDARKNILGQSIAFMQKHEMPQMSNPERSAMLAGMARAVVLPVIRKEIAAIRKLGAPAGDEDEIGAFLGVEQGDAVGLAAAKSLGSTVALERYFGPSGKLARAYGIAECANG